jgi:drug/metabolite transporter (DMT)-like permease
MPPTPNRSMTAFEWLILIGLSALWGGSFFFTGIAVQELPPVTVVVLRVGLAAVILHVAIRAMGLRMASGHRAWAAFFGMGLLNNAIPFSLIVWGQINIASGLASILNATTPLWTVLVAHLLTRDEKVTGNRLVGVAVGFSGVVVTVGPDVLNGLRANAVAELAVLGAALSYALAGVFGRRFKTMGMAPIQTATGQVTASTAMLIPIALVMDRPWHLGFPSQEVWGALVGMAVLSTALAYVLYFRLLASAGAVNLLLVTFLIPVSAVLLGSLLLGERLAPQHFAGMGLIGLGLACIDGRLFKRRHLQRASRQTGAVSGSVTRIRQEP